METETLAVAPWEVWHLVQVLLKEVIVSSPTELPGWGGWLTNWRTIIPKKFSPCRESPRPHNRLSNPGIQQMDWVSPENLILKVRRSWLQKSHRVRVTESWRAQASRPRRKEQWPQQDWAKLACVCLGIFGGGMGRQWPAWGQGHWLQRSWEALHADVSPFEGGYCHHPSLS